MVDHKIRMQSRATENYKEPIFEEMKELEEQKSEETLLTCVENTLFVDIRTNEMKQEGCRDLEGREGWRRARRTFSPSSHAGHRRWITSKR